MKTILYQPLFINPQAYFVFPQLYNIEKGDQYIEPAVYTGQLLIDVLTDNTFVTISDTNYLDFSEFAGKRIRISQYTDTGDEIEQEKIKLNEIWTKRLNG